MSWLSLCVGLTTLTAGIIIRIVKRGAENADNKLRIASVGIIAFGVLMIGAAFDLGFYWVFSVGILALAWMEAVVLWYSPTSERPQPPTFSDKMSRKESNALRGAAYMEYSQKESEFKKIRKQYYRNLLLHPLSRAPWASVALAALAVGVVVVWRLVVYVIVGFDSSFNPTPWGVLAMASAVCITAILTHRYGRWWVSLLLLAVGATFLSFTTVFAVSEIASAQTPKERAEAAENEPTVKMLTVVEATCPRQFIIPSKKDSVWNDLIPDQATIDKIDAPVEAESARNPNLLLELLQAKVDKPQFKNALERTLRSEFKARGEDFDQERFDRFVSGVPSMKAQDITVPYGDVLCMDPDGQAIHVAMFG